MKATVPRLLLLMSLFFVFDRFGGEFLRAQTVSNVKFASAFTGSDAGAQINAAETNLPSAGGTIIIDLPGTQNFSTTIAISKPTRLVGGTDGTTLTYTGTGSAILVQAVEDVTLENFKIVLQTNTAIGIDWQDSSHGHITDVKVYGTDSRSGATQQVGLRLCTTVGTVAGVTSAYWNVITSSLFRKLAHGILLTGTNPNGAPVLTCATGSHQTDPLNGPGGTMIVGTTVQDDGTGINAENDTGGSFVTGSAVEGFTSGVRVNNATGFTIGQVRFEDSSGGTAVVPTSNAKGVLVLGAFDNATGFGAYPADTVLATSINGALITNQYGNSVLTANNQRDFCFFGNCATLLGQSGNFSSYVRVFGGAGLGRHLALGVDVTGTNNPFIQSLIGGDLELRSFAATDLNNQTLTANGQHDANFFGAGGVSQSGSFNNRVHLFGGTSQSRSLDLYQVVGGNATVESVSAGDLELKSSGNIQFTASHLNQSAANSDKFFTITLASGTATKTWATAYTSSPVVVCSNQSNQSALKVAPTSTNVVITSPGATDVAACVVHGNPN